MFNQYARWISKNKELLLDQWECGFHHPSGDPIMEDTFEDFVLAQWESKCQDQK